MSLTLALTDVYTYVWFFFVSQPSRPVYIECTYMSRLTRGFLCLCLAALKAKAELERY